MRKPGRFVLVAALAVVASFITASAASPQPLDGPFLLPAGSTATFSGPTVGGCNALVGGYRLDDGDLTTLVSKPYTCDAGSTGGDVTIGPFLTDRQLLVVLEDQTCEATYNSDATPVDHVNVDGSNPYTVRFADAGGFCERARTPFTDFSGGNFTVGLSITEPLAPQITLSPSDATLTVGETHTLTATVTQGNEPVPQQDVTFTVVDGPNVDLTGEAVTNADGTATFSYSSSEVGTDEIQASYTDAQEQQHTSNSVTANWVESPPAPSAISLSPSDATLTVGDTHTLTATATQGGDALPDQDVTFTVVDGPNAGVGGHATTTADGTASFAYSSSKIGTDHIQASFTDSREQMHTSNAAAATWVAKSSPPPPPASSPPPQADVHVSVSPPSFGRAGQRMTFTATVANGGPDPATGVTLRTTLPAGATLVSASESRGNGCNGGTCSIGTLAPGDSATVTLVVTIDRTGTLSLSASAESDYDPDTSNNAAAAGTTVIAADAPPPPPAPPAQPGTFNAIDVGTVLVNGVQRPADALFQLKAGDTVDVTNGVLVFTTSDGSTGAFSSSQPTARRHTASAKAGNLPAVFTVDQAASGGVTTLTLTGADFAGCSSKRSLSANQTPIRQVWGSAKGNFTTKGRFAAATVRGTIWLVQDRCDGTLTQVLDGVVAVADSTLGKTVSVAAGQSYVAPAAAPFKPPAAKLQTAVQIKRDGLRWAGRIFRTKAAFAAWLSNAGSSWRAFARAHPAQAKALAARG